VIVREEDRLGAIVLASRPVTNPDPNPVREAMLVGIKEMGLDSLPWSRTATEWRARILSLRHWQPEAGWPDLSDQELLATLDEWLAPWLEGMSRQQHLKKLDLQTILRARLDWGRQQQMESLAPTHIMVPSGSRKRLQYRPGEAPVLQVRLQEMFGLGETPRICNHQVPVVLHLLSPAQRPIQVTQDLRGFWERTYKEVRKELKGRYPKHYWPENPWAAEATARVRPPGHR
jgi:ATP-dependent helicase HrpB